jgi:uncharacterized protein YbcV (DUF1398 family)
LYELLIGSVFIFFIIMMTQGQLINPAYRLMGYRYYYITANDNIKIVTISKEEIWLLGTITLDNLRRMDNKTYIEL